MGLKESQRIQKEVVERLDDNPNGMCVPLALIESFPDGFPPPDMHDELIKKTIDLLSDWEQMSKEEFWNTIVAFFWPDKTIDNLRFRSADDPEILAILGYVYEHRLPIIACITNPNHAIGLRFIENEGVGTVAELITCFDGERPYIPLNGCKIHDGEGLLERRFFNAGGCFAVFPPLGLD